MKHLLLRFKKLNDIDYDIDWLIDYDCVFSLQSPGSYDVYICKKVWGLSRFNANEEFALEERCENVERSRMDHKSQTLLF